VLVPAGGGVGGLDDYWDGSHWLSRSTLPEET
jgi:hypothetical protein